MLPGSPDPAAPEPVPPAWFQARSPLQNWETGPEGADLKSSGVYVCAHVCSTPIASPKPIKASPARPGRLWAASLMALEL